VKKSGKKIGSRLTVSDTAPAPTKVLEDSLRLLFAKAASHTGGEEADTEQGKRSRLRSGAVRTGRRGGRRWALGRNRGARDGRCHRRRADDGRRAFGYDHRRALRRRGQVALNGWNGWDGEYRHALDGRGRSEDIDRSAKDFVAEGGIAEAQLHAGIGRKDRGGNKKRKNKFHDDVLRGLFATAALLFAFRLA